MNLAERMKQYEHVYRGYLPRRTYTLLRLDGRAFHRYTKAMDRPFDDRLIHAMNETAIELVNEITGTQFAYVQSDEISLLVTDFQNHETQPWMGGNINKVLSLSAATATAAFNAEIDSGSWGWATFDSRVWTMSDAPEVANYFIWRQRDCIKNSVTMVAQVVFSEKQLDRLNTTQRKELLLSAGVDWDDFADKYKRGRVVFRKPHLKNEVVRYKVVVTDAPEFTARPGSWLGDMIPSLPSLA